jgi:pyruvate dehydrogenase E1 component beta subunit
MDFMLLAVDPIVNQAANWSYMFAGKVGVPVVIRAIINRGGEQAAQHSQALQAMFAHVPGLKVVMPATPEDAKGLLAAAVYDGNPVMYIDDRWLYEQRGPVPEEPYRTPIGKAAVRRAGRDLTLVASSFLLPQSLEAAAALARDGVDVEVIDLRTIKPWDREMVCASVRKTGRLLVADGTWTTGGVAAEIVATVASDAFGHLKAAPGRLGLVDTPAPMSKPLEREYYLRADDVAEAVRRAMRAPTAARSLERS